MASGELHQDSRDHGEDAARKRRVIIGALGNIAGLALLAAPAAAVYGLTHAETDDFIGANKAQFSINTESKSVIDTGIGGALSIPINVGVYGISVEVKGIDTAPDGTSDVSSLVSDETLTRYASLYGDPRQAVEGIKDLLIEDALQKALIAEAVAIGGIILIIGGGRLLIREDLKQKKLLSPLLTSGIFITELAGIANMSTTSLEYEEEARVITSLDGTYFEGSSTEDEPMQTILDRVVPSIKNLGRRQNNFLKEYQAAAKNSLKAQKEGFATPRSNEEVIMTFSDLHCSYAMIPLLGEVADIYKPQTVISAGDDTNFGSALENGCIQREKTITTPKNIVVAGGNHDSKITEKQMNDAGINLLTGKTLEVNGTTVLGDDDPEITPPLTSGIRVFEDEEETEIDLGTRILKQAINDQPDIIALHQPTAIEPIIEYLNNPKDTSVRIASLVLNGHTHQREGPHFTLNNDGTWTMRYQMGTAGGVGTATLTSFSTPFSKPLTPSETTIFFKDKTSRLITGYQILVFETDGTVSVNPRVDVGSIDGQPFTFEEIQLQRSRSIIAAQ